MRMHCCQHLEHSLFVSPVAQPNVLEFHILRMTHVIQTDSRKEAEMRQAFSKMNRTHWNTNSNDIVSHTLLVRAADQPTWKLTLRDRGSFCEQRHQPAM